MIDTILRKNRVVFILSEIVFLTIFSTTTKI